MSDRIKIGMVEDQFLFLNGMKALTESWEDVEFVFESPDGYSLMERLSNAEIIPDVMLVDLTLPEYEGQNFGGDRVLELIRSNYPSMKVIILSVHSDNYFIARLIERGANGYLAKDSDPDEVRDAIIAVHEKGGYVNAQTLEALQDRLTGKVKIPRREEPLSRREIEVLELICQQLTSEEIADKLFISVKTVNGHRNNLMQKTGSRNVTGLVLYALRKGLVETI